MIHALKVLIYSVKSYGVKSIYLKNILITTLLTVALLCVLGVLLLNLSLNRIENDTNNFFLNGIIKTKDNLDKEFERIDNISYRIVGDKSVDTLRQLNNIDPLDYNTFSNIKDLYDLLAKSLTLNDLIESFEIYFYNSRSVVRSDNVLLSYNDSKNKEVVDSLLSLENRRGKNNYIPFNSPPNNRGIGKILSVPLFSSEYKDVLFLRLNMAKLVGLISDKVNAENIRTLIISESGEIIGGMGEGSEGQVLIKQMNSEYGSFETNDNHNSFKWVYARSKYNGWIYATSIRNDYYNNTINEFIWNFVWLIIPVVFLSICLSVLVTGKTSEPISMFLSIVKNPVEWLTSEKGMKGMNFSETQHIANSIVDSYRQNVKLGEQLEKRVSMLKEAQMVALRSQINPHFMYNTLDSINWSVLEALGKDNEISGLIVSLSDFLSYSLEGKSDFVTILEEINHAKAYLDIQLYRYDYCFEVEWDVPEALFNHKIIKITLQPFLENAAFHGIGNESSGGLIKVSVSQEDSHILILIEDNGKGIEPDLLQEIRNKLDRSVDERELPYEHIGIYNVFLRYKLVFWENSSIEISSEVGAGTKVLLRYPIIIEGAKLTL